MGRMALALFGLFAIAVAASSSNNERSTEHDRPRRLRREDQQQQQEQIADGESLSQQQKQQRELFGTNLVAKWVKEAKEDLEEIQEMLTKALDDDSSMPPIPVAPPTRAPTRPTPAPPPPTSVPVPLPPTTSAPTFTCGVSPEERSRTITSDLSTVSKEADIEKAGSPQNMALNWLLSEDGLYLCPDSPTLIQRYVAAVFYYSSIGDGWTQCSAPEDLNDAASVAEANANCNIVVDSGVGGTDAWLTAVSECNWGGMVCEDNENALERIDFESNNLQGTIPFELQELSQLRFLHLEEGKTAGIIPSELGNLSSLEELDLNFNLLVGPVPDTIYNLAELKELDLNDNLLEGSLSPDIGKLSKLRFFQISKNRITGTIPTEMGQLTELAIANFDRNQMMGTMPQEVCNLRDIENGLIGSLTCDCLDSSAKFYVECQTPQCCTQCFEPSLIITGDIREDEVVLPDNRADSNKKNKKNKKKDKV